MMIANYRRDQSGEPLDVIIELFDGQKAFAFGHVRMSSSQNATEILVPRLRSRQQQQQWELVLHEPLFSKRVLGSALTELPPLSERELAIGGGAAIGEATRIIGNEELSKPLLRQRQRNGCAHEDDLPEVLSTGKRAGCPVQAVPIAKPNPG